MNVTERLILGVIIYDWGHTIFIQNWAFDYSSICLTLYGLVFLILPRPCDWIGRSIAKFLTRLIFKQR